MRSNICLVFNDEGGLDATLICTQALTQRKWRSLVNQAHERWVYLDDRTDGGMRPNPHFSNEEMQAWVNGVVSLMLYRAKKAGLVIRHVELAEAKWGYT